MQTFKTAFAVISVSLFTISYYPYVRDMFKRKTEPHAYTWLIWSMTQGTAIAGIWYGKGGLVAYGLIWTEFLLFIVLALSFKYGTKNITTSDKVALVSALVAILVWWQLHNPSLAILMVSLIDAVGYIPTYRKLWSEPWSETLISWVMFFIGNVLVLFALENYNLLTLPYQLTITFCNLILILIIYIRRKKIGKPR